jgi:DNA-binding transcriptional regulator YdaS (Cro superfamily)
MLTQYIKNSGRSRTAWAADLGISKSYLSDILNGNKFPSLELAVRIQRATQGAVMAADWFPEDRNAAGAA